MGKDQDDQKACSFDATSLQIGNWKLRLTNPRSSGVNRIVAKFYFKKDRKMAWELGGKYSKKIEIEFQSIVAIRFVTGVNLGGEGAFQILLKTRPQFCKEVNPEPNKHTKYGVCDDFTAGRQASLYRVHSLTFPLKRLEKLRESLFKAESGLFEELNRMEAFPKDHGLLVFEDPEPPCISYSIHPPAQKRRRVFPASTSYNSHQPPPPHYMPIPTQPPAAYSCLQQQLTNFNCNSSDGFPAAYAYPPPTAHFQSYEALPPPISNGFMTASPPGLTYQEMLQDHHHHLLQQEDGTSQNAAGAQHATQLPAAAYASLPIQQLGSNFNPSNGFIPTSAVPYPHHISSTTTTFSQNCGLQSSSCHPPLPLPQLQTYEALPPPISNGTIMTTSPLGLTYEETPQDHHHLQQEHGTQDTATATHPPAAAYSLSVQQRPDQGHQQLTSSNGFIPTASAPGLSCEEIYQELMEDIPTSQDIDSPAVLITYEEIYQQFKEVIATTATPTQQPDQPSAAAAAAADSSLEKLITNCNSSNGLIPTASAPGLTTYEEIYQQLKEDIATTPTDHTQQPHHQPPAYSSQQQLTNANSSDGYPTTTHDIDSSGHKLTFEEILFQDDHLQQEDWTQNDARQDEPTADDLISNISFE